MWLGSSARSTFSRSAAGALLVAAPLVAASASALAPNLRLESNLPGAHFGETMASAGDVNGDGIEDLVIGAPYYGNGEDTEGAVFLFLGKPQGLVTGGVEQADAVIESNQAMARLGTSVAAGDVNGDGYSDLLVGAGGWDGSTAADEGAVFVFLGSMAGIASGGLELASATLEGGWINARLGTSVAAADINGDGRDDVIAGGRLFQNDANVTGEGYALIFLSDPQNPNGIASAGLATASAVIESNRCGAQLGYSLANAGDINHDGYQDLVIGAPRWTGSWTVCPSGTESPPDSREGAALIYLGSANGIPSGDWTSADRVIEGNQPDSYFGFGRTVLGVGDLNGDSYDDIAVAAPRWDTNPNVVNNEGAVFLFYGGPNGIAATGAEQADARLDGGQVDVNPTPLQPRENFGIALAAGDADGDGHRDLLVSSPYYDHGQTDEGAAFLFRGSATGIASTSATAADRILESNVKGAWMGASVALVDVNHDGHADMFVGGNRMGWPIFGLPGQTDADEGMVLGFPLVTACQNGIDDDGDGNIDLLDAGCVDADDPREEVDYANGGTNTITTAIGDAVVAHDQPQGAPTTVVLAASGSTARDLLAIEHSALRLDGGSVAGNLVASDSATAEILAGSIAGSVRATGSAMVAIHGGSIAALAARDGARIEIYAFDLPDGDVAALSGTLAGTLEDGTPISVPFERDAGATIHLVNVPIPPACQNGLDDDGDSLVDLDDPGCADANDPHEEVDFADGAIDTITTTIDDSVLAHDLPPDTPTTVVLGVGGSAAGDFVAIEHSALRLDGGSVTGNLVAGDSATAAILAGSITGSVRATGNALVAIHGGSVVALEARDGARIELYGLHFALPNGDVAALSGTIAGTLEDGTPISATFVRDAAATIHLVPEPAAALLALASLGSLSALRRRRRSSS